MMSSESQMGEDDQRYLAYGKEMQDWQYGLMVMSYMMRVLDVKDAILKMMLLDADSINIQEPLVVIRDEKQQQYDYNQNRRIYWFYIIISLNYIKYY